MRLSVSLLETRQLTGVMQDLAYIYLMLHDDAFSLTCTQQARQSHSYQFPEEDSSLDQAEPPASIGCQTTDELLLQGDVDQDEQLAYCPTFYF